METKAERSLRFGKLNIARREHQDYLAAAHIPCKYCGADLSYRSDDEQEKRVCVNCLGAVVRLNELHAQLGV